MEPALVRAPKGMPLLKEENFVPQGLSSAIFTDSLRSAERFLSAAGLRWEEGLRHVAMYVNDLSVDPGPLGRAAVVDLYARAFRADCLPQVEPRWA